MKTWRSLAAVIAVAMMATACADSTDPSDDPTDGAAQELSGEVLSAGSSTVFPVAQGIQELYAAAQPDVTVGLDSIGSGGGFERFCDEGSTDISNASRAIKQEEADLCAANGIEFLEVRIGTDALTMVTSPATDYLTCLTTEQIIQVFGPDAASTWDEVIEGAPADPIQVFSPGTDSGTFDFMVEDIMETEGVRADYSDVGEADQQTVQGVREGTGTWGYFGLAYFTANGEGLTAIAHDAGDGTCVQPSVEAALDGSYALTRPLYIYVRVDSLQEKPQVADYVSFFLENVNEVIDVVGYVRATDEELQASKDAVAAAIG